MAYGFLARTKRLKGQQGTVMLCFQGPCFIKSMNGPSAKAYMMLLQRRMKAFHYLTILGNTGTNLCNGPEHWHASLLLT